MVCDNSSHQAVKSCTFIVMALLPYLPTVMAMAGEVLLVRCSCSTTTLSCSRERENLWKEGGRREGGGKGEGKESGREGRREGGRGKEKKEEGGREEGGGDREKERGREVGRRETLDNTYFHNYLTERRESTLAQMNKVVIHIPEWKEQYATDIVLATLF